MLKGETIIYFGPEPWDGLWRNRHQLMSRFAEHNDVWYVEPATNLRNLFTGQGKRRSRLFSRDASGVGVFHSPWWLPTTGRAPFRNISIRIFLAVISLVAKTGRKRRPIVWFSRPSMIDYLGKLKAKLTVYHVVDEYSGYDLPSTARRSKPRNREDEMLRKADIVIVVTPTLFDLKSPHNPNTHLVPNAVDYDSYADCDTHAPDDMSGIPGPIVGYSGLIAARLDLHLLQAAAESRPKWNFVFVGAVNDEHCETELRRLGDLSNVHFLGEKLVHDVPGYVHQFDVCIIPYILNLRAQHSSPLKLYEYAAAAKPVVTTDFEAARAFQGHVSIAGDTDEFVAACERSIALDSAAPEILENRQFAAENTWAHRVQQISEILSSADFD
jgi:glycosyltransferase involved in cell wall biosynthesis